mgnify:FL=1|jgi:hypothetical protein
MNNYALKKYYFEDKLYDFLNVKENDRNKKYTIDELKYILINKYNVSKKHRYIKLSKQDIEFLGYKNRSWHYNYCIKERISDILSKIYNFKINTEKIDNSYFFYDDIVDVVIEDFSKDIKNINCSYLII